MVFHSMAADKINWNSFIGNTLEKYSSIEKKNYTVHSLSESYTCDKTGT